ncbi:unnamed protein product [Prorocentrum cordatum]|uniref:Uncharacterized protein n=1 Tax=Prorocentrum cordatum TaxID=2364126 RepID=A0ABN9W5P2_9DINO|nr:unnamed protein product [Polarella glacialis]
MTARVATTISLVASFFQAVPGATSMKASMVASTSQKFKASNAAEQLLGVVTCGQSSLRDDYDAAAPFSEGAAGSFQSTGQVGTWEFLAASSMNSGTGTPLTFTSSSNNVRTGNTFIRSGQVLDLPTIGLGVNSAVISPSTSEGQIEAGYLGLHPGYEGNSEKYLLVRFTPAAGATVFFDFTIKELGVECGGLEASVRVGGSMLSSTTAIRSGAPWSFQNSVATGDPIEVYIGPGVHYACDHSEIHMHVLGSTCPSTPTPAPTLAPTPSPTPSPSQATSLSSATGDPHLQNMFGQRFDLVRPGTFVLVSVPRGTPVEDALLVVKADAHRLGSHCSDMYFREINATGKWANKARPGGFHFDARDARDETPEWLKLGPVELKVGSGHTDKGQPYLNVYVKNLQRTGYRVGGLLGEDDHTEAAAPEKGCQKMLSLDARLYGQAENLQGSVAIAN